MAITKVGSEFVKEAFVGAGLLRNAASTGVNWLGRNIPKSIQNYTKPVRPGAMDRMRRLSEYRKTMANAAAPTVAKPTTPRKWSMGRRIGTTLGGATLIGGGISGALAMNQPKLPRASQPYQQARAQA